MARRRYQRGALRREGSSWILRWREDVLDKAGSVVRVERRARVGSTKDLGTKALARRVADRMIEHVNQPNYMPGKVATVQEFSEVYRANVCPTFKPSSCESARSLCRIYIEPVLGPYRLDQVKGEVPQLLVNDLRRRGLSRKTILNALSTLASMLGAARDWNYLSPELDWRKLRLPVEELQKPQRFFTPDESQRIIDAAPAPWHLCFAFMAYLGVRTSEAVGIAWEHLDISSGVLLVRQSNWRGKLLTVKSKASVRDLPFTAGVSGHASTIPAPVATQCVRVAVRKRKGTTYHQLLRPSGHPTPDTRATGYCARWLPCFPAWLGHCTNAGRCVRASSTTAARSCRLTHAGAVCTRRPARPTNGCRTHNGCVFAAFCGELGR